jgi:hypothetical protein
MSRRTADDLARERDGASRQVAFNELIDQPGAQRVGGVNRLAGHAHLDRLLHTDEPRQPLRTFGARNNPEIDFGLTHSSLRNGHTIVSGHGKLEPAAERGAVHRDDNWLGTLFDKPQQVVQVRRLAGAPRSLFELLDVGTCNKRPARAHDDDAVCGRIVDEACDDGRQFLTNGAAKGVNRGVVDLDDGNAVTETGDGDIVAIL